ncbi:hypothetical protein IHE45_09G073100 [Dioscorea alata]|uniref:Uncharacterized protein n=1 Tax=Dioscorea alata TaxID=55571 RepID=A0ACB7VFX2_DIOAL|nr:hypothetical protein IHE45_09G073100 [Dioscorea alata]
MKSFLSLFIALSRYSFPPPGHHRRSPLLSLLHHRSAMSPRQSLPLSLSCVWSPLSRFPAPVRRSPFLSFTTDPGRRFLPVFVESVTNKKVLIFVRFQSL